MYGSWLVAGLAIVGLLAEYWVAPYPLSPPDTPGYYATLAATRPARGAEPAHELRPARLPALSDRPPQAAHRGLYQPG